jgi:hypothetical protein
MALQSFCLFLVLALGLVCSSPTDVEATAAFADAPTASPSSAAAAAASPAAASAAAAAAADEPDCSTRILTRERRAWLTPGSLPPRAPPLDLLWAFTRCGRVPLGEYFVDDSDRGRGTHYRYSAAEMARQLAAARALVASVARLATLPPAAAAASLLALQARGGLVLLAEALRRHAGAVAGKRALVFGSQTPVVETLLLAHNASSVMTVEYNALSYEGVETLTPDELRGLPAAARAFDVVLSISSFDHDGLGRYGDPLAPDGDLLSSDAIRDEGLLAPGGLYFLTVPVGPDVVVWNLHRRYGEVRLPLLLEGWDEVERVGWEEGVLTAERSFAKTKEPVFVLRAPSRAAADAAADAAANAAADAATVAGAAEAAPADTGLSAVAAAGAEAGSEGAANISADSGAPNAAEL